MRLLIAFDGSECALAAIEDLSRAGLPSKATALVLTVLDSASPPDDPARIAASPRLRALHAAVETGLEESRSTAQRGAAGLRALFPEWDIIVEACAGSPAAEIINHAENLPESCGGGSADLVVVGSHGHGEFRRWLLGSVSHQVVTNARIAVRVARGKKGVAVPTPVPRIIVGADGSPAGDAAVETVIRRDWPDKAQILVATFDRSLSAGSLQPTIQTVWGGEPVDLLAGEAVSSGSDRIAATAGERIRAAHPGAIVSTLVRVGDPKYGLLQLAEKWGEGHADAIFVGARGARGLERFLLGSVSGTVAMAATCSVEIARPRTH